MTFKHWWMHFSHQTWHISCFEFCLNENEAENHKSNGHINTINVLRDLISTLSTKRSGWPFWRKHKMEIVLRMEPWMSFYFYIILQHHAWAYKLQISFIPRPIQFIWSGTDRTRFDSKRTSCTNLKSRRIKMITFLLSQKARKRNSKHN